MANARPGGDGRPRRTPLQALIYWTLVMGVWGAIALVGFLAVFAWDLPDTSKLYDVDRQPSISYLDRSGAVVAVRGSQYAPPVDIDALPRYVPDAFVAIEDRQFYHHFGFNPWGMVRSEIYNLSHPGGPLRGGSTITQQLARNLFLTPTQSYRRKAQELILSVWLEMHFSKKQILALYLNRVNFGGGAYGIEAAAQRYFNKPAKDLTLGEAALLAATMKGPSRYNPAANSERAAKRATVVLHEMVRMGAITPAERDAAFATPVHVSATLANQRAQYFVDWLDAQVRSQVGEPTEDLVVETVVSLLNLGGRRAGLAPGTEDERDPQQVMLERERSAPLDGRVEMDDAYLGGARSGGKRGRGSPGKTPFLAAVATTAEGKAHRVKLRRIKRFTKKAVKKLTARIVMPGAHVVTDGLGCFKAVEEAGCTHQAIVMRNGRKAGRHPAFRAVNTVLANIKTAITATFHAGASKHAPRRLAEFAYRFNRRYDLAAMILRLGYIAVRTPPMPCRLLKLAEDHG